MDLSPADLASAAGGIRAIKGLIDMFEAIVNRARAAHKDIPASAQLLLDRSKNLYETLQSATLNRSDSEIPKPVLSTMSTLIDVLDDANKLADNSLNANIFLRFLNAPRRQDKLKEAADKLTQIAGDASFSSSGTRVAIKRFDGIKGIDAKAREMVVHEARTWCELQHPHVLQMQGISLASDPPFFVMPLMENGDLSKYAVGRPGEHLRLLHETAMGMAYLHSKLIFHGDLKANNVLVDHGSRAQVCDFGMSRLLSAAVTRASTYVPGSSAGNVRWLAPERYVRGAKYQTEPDIFAFAMVVI
ncbi:hypothetical protein GGF32_002820 [Allomyces javanicus]|nr:hypothetical protein GGF32_002820 [Allomyces javanicus]